jgi:hypothetical protein
MGDGEEARAGIRSAPAGRSHLNRHDLVIDPASGSVTDPSISDVTEVSQARHHQGVGCTEWTLRARATPNQTIVNGIARNGVSILVRYSSAATTTSQTGISYNNRATWGVSGSRSRGSSFTAAYNAETAGTNATLNREYRVQWRHSDYTRHCPTNPYGGYQVQDITDPDFATGGATVVNSRYGVFSCRYAGTRAQVASVSTQSATATMYSAAFSAFGFSGGSRSGYNSETRITYRFNSTSGGYWCGDNNYPAQAARVRAWR